MGIIFLYSSFCFFNLLPIFHLYFFKGGGTDWDNQYRTLVLMRYFEITPFYVGVWVDDPF